MSAVFGTGRIAYPGLRAFGREEFDLFFGRESCVDEMVDTLGRTSFLAVLGTSGSGKSSLVRTGLLNALELGFLASAGSTWRIAELRPRGHPIRSLAIALLEVQGNPAPNEAEIEILSAFLRRGPRSLIEWANSGHIPPRANLMVLVDQFEELFRYQDYSGREEAEAFVGLLVAAARESIPIYVAITMRSEYLGACTLIEGLPEVINRGLYLTPRMSREECRQAIVGPAEVCGFGIEDRLVNKLLNDLTDFAPWDAGGGHDQQRRLGRRADQLPLMQHVLNLLWQKARARNETDIVLALADYEAAGGLGGALDRHADEIASSVPAEHADAIEPVFRSLVTGRTVEDAVRRPTRFGEIVELAERRREAVAAVIDAFRAQGVNFLTPGQPDAILADTIIDISHESLIRQWRRLSRCLDEEAHSADAWHQLLSRSERYAAGSGSLLTGLDLDNLVAWWARTKPIPAWADRYGNNFTDAERYLRDSQFAEAERKRRDEEEERKLLAAEQAANTGRRFKRLAGALAAALIIAFGAVGAAIYLWRESNAEALAAIEAQAEADRQRTIAEAALIDAEEQRAIAEAEATSAEVARQEADRQRAIAEAERAEAERQREFAEAQRRDADRARAAAEAAEQAAILARLEADRIIDSSIAYFAKSLGDEVATIHGDPTKLVADLGYAGGLLARLAEDSRTKVDTGPDVDTSFIDALRPAFAVQAALSSRQIPSTEPSATATAVRWIDPPGGTGLTATLDSATRTMRLRDGTGRVAARYQLPTEFRSGETTMPLGAAEWPGEAPFAIIADASGQLWAADDGHGSFQPVLGGGLGVVRIDDVMIDAATGRAYVATGMGRTGERGQSILGSGLRVARLIKTDGEWQRDGLYKMPRGPLMRGDAPFRLAGLGQDALVAVADGAVMRTDLAAARTTAIDLPALVFDAGITPDGRYLLLGGLRDDSGACFEAASRSGQLQPWPIPERLRPQLAAAVPLVADAPGTTLAPPSPAALECLLLYDLEADLPLWRGVGKATHFDTMRLADDGAVAVVEGDPSALRVLRIAREDDSWNAMPEAFDPTIWGLGGFADAFATATAAGATPPAALSVEAVSRLMGEGVLNPLAESPAGRTIASRVGDDDLQIAIVPEETEETEDAIEILVYRPGEGGFVRDERIDTEGVGCRAPEGEDTCRFDSAAFSPDGNWLLVTSNGSHAFLGKDGMLADWTSNSGASDGDGAISTLTFDSLAPLDPSGRAFVASTVEDGVLRRVVRVDAPAQGGGDDRFPRQGPRGVDVKAGDATGAEGAGGTGGTLGGAPGLATAVTEIRLPGHIESDVSGFTTDPEHALLYVWGPRIGIRALPGTTGDMLIADVALPGPVADATVTGTGDVAVVTIDGQIGIVPAARFDRSTLGDTAAPLPMIATGLGSYGTLEIWANADTVIVNAGRPRADGIAVDPETEPSVAVAVDVARMRSLGFHVDENGALHPAFIVPWDHLAGQLRSGETASVETGGVIFSAPPALPEDDRLLALTVMREEKPSVEAPEFEIGYDMLHMRFVGGDGAVLAIDNCGWVLGIAVRMAGELQENITEDVKRACDEPATTAPLINAIFDDRFDERVGVLLRLAPQSALARAVLTSSLLPVAPRAGAVLAAGGADEQWETALIGLAENGPLPRGLVPPATPGLDPFAHWLTAMADDSAGASADALATALFHYAYAERLFDRAGVVAPVPVIARRLALARVLSDDIVYDVFTRLANEPLDPAATGLVEADLTEAPLDTVASWLATMSAGDADKTERLEPLAALIAEMRGDEAVASDPGAAARHYHEALALVLGSEESLAEDSGILGQIEEAEEIGAKLAVLGDPTAKPDTAAAVLTMIDGALEQPVRRDVDPPELRIALAEAFLDLAAAGESGFDLATLRGLRLRFLDFDWESRYQAISEVGADRFYRELAAVESFADAALASAPEPDRVHWLTIRGRLRFWLSTMEFEGLGHETAVFRDWLKRALADYEEAGGPQAVSLWDATIIGGVNSRMIELAATDEEALAYVERAAAAFRAAIDRSDAAPGHVGPSEDFLDVEQYRRRLTYDGYMLALERGVNRLRDRLLAEVVDPRGDTDARATRLAELGYAALDLGRRREALRAEAEVNGLIEQNTAWSLDSVGDAYWGSIVALLGGEVRRDAGLNGTPDLCERLAAHPYDVTRSATAVATERLDVDAVLATCDEDTARSLFLRGRAVAKDGGGSADSTLRLVLPAAREGIPGAYYDIGMLVSATGGNGADAQGLMTTFAELSLITAYSDIAALLRDEKTSATRAETFEWLAHKAAALGVAEGYIETADLTPDVLTRALNYTIAQNLFRAAGRTEDAEAIEARLAAFNLSSSNIADLDRQADALEWIKPALIDDALVGRIEDILWDSRSQATLN